MFWYAFRFFYYSKKWIKETVLTFVEKMKLNVQLTFEMVAVAFVERTMSKTHEYNSVITDLRKAAKMSIRDQQ